MIARLAMGAALLGALASPASAQTYHGKASYYHEGKYVACRGLGVDGTNRYDPDELTAAWPVRKCGMKVRVTNLANDKFVDVVITDLGPADWVVQKHGVIIDLSRGAFRQIADLRAGHVKVKVEVIE